MLGAPLPQQPLCPLLALSPLSHAPLIMLWALPPLQLWANVSAMMRFWGGDAQLGVTSLPRQGGAAAANFINSRAEQIAGRAASGGHGGAEGGGVGGGERDKGKRRRDEDDEREEEERQSSMWWVDKAPAKRHQKLENIRFLVNTD